jgi:hypothetical protein
MAERRSAMLSRSRVTGRRSRPHRGRRRRGALKAFSALGLMMGLGLFGMAGTVVGSAAPAGATAKQPHLVAMPYATKVPKAVSIPKRGEFDCNGDSPVEKPSRAELCTDIRGLEGVQNANTWGGKFYDNGHYIGHDEPDMTFLSNRPGSGNNVTWNETLPVDPTAAPTVGTPGKNVSHWFELSPAPWYSMAMCDPYSYPQMPCTPESNSNAPSCPTAFDCPSNSYPGGGSAFMELQFYPPGNPPFVDNESCNDSGWCAAVTIDSLECTNLYYTCQTQCEEPINFAFVQKNGVPTGPAGPGDSDFATSVPNSETLIMKPGDKISVHMFDAPAPKVKGALGGKRAFEVVIDDLTQHTSGYMQASAKNGFQFIDMNCDTADANWQPEYSTAAPGNIIPWAALQTNISTEYETGHFEVCSSLSGSYTSNPAYGNPFDPYDTGGTYSTCSGGDEVTSGASEGPELTDGLCYPANDTHPGWDEGTGTAQGPPIDTCQDNATQNGDLDFDGTPYRTEWPTGSKPTSLYPSSFVESLPTSGGRHYSRFYFQTDIALSEDTCTAATLSGCTVPPTGSEVNQPNHRAFYPYWSEVDSHGTCTVEFGNVSSGAGVNDFGRDTQYGTVQYSTLGYPEFEGKIYDNTCRPKLSEGYYLSGRANQLVVGGDAPSLPGPHGVQGRIVDIAATPNGRGYFAVSDTGAVYTGGDAVFHGDLTSLKHPVTVTDIVAITPTTNGGGYWLLGSGGAVYAFGNAKYHDSLPGVHKHVTDIVGMAITSGGTGYLLAGANGAVYAFGSARSHGSLPSRGIRVDDIRAIVASTSGSGYLLVGANGAVYVFGKGAPFHGSLPGKKIRVDDIVGIALTSDGGGYWMAGSNGAVYSFGDARPLTSNFRASDAPISSITGVTTDTVNP